MNPTTTRRIILVSVVFAIGAGCALLSSCTTFSVTPNPDGTTTITLPAYQGSPSK